MKKCADIVALFSILPFLACPWWIYIQPDLSNVNSLPLLSALPLQFQLLLIGAVTFPFGLAWLLVRYAASLDQKFGFVSRWRAPYVLAFLLIVLPAFLMKFTWR